MALADISSRAFLDELTLIASKAAAEIMAIRRVGLEVRLKPDSSPVTAADQAAEDIIVAGLRRLAPDLPVIAEESVTAGMPLPPGMPFALVDPLDGTREFIGGSDEFAVNIGIVKDTRALVGLIASPARNMIWRGVVGHGAERLQLAAGDPPSKAVRISTIHVREADHPEIALVSRSHLDPQTEQFVGRFPSIERHGCGSSVKFAMLAEGAADIYPRLSPTMEWDVCAGDAIVTAAGGTVRTPDGDRLTYGHAERGFVVASFIARGAPNSS
jgi:3'(2'), 5'-bisphosphate nucleotidase